MGSRLIVLALIVIAAAAGAYWVSRPEPPPPIVGVVRATEVRIAPEVSAMLTAIKVHKGDRVRAGEVVAELSAIEITASVGQARAALDSATADRNNVYSGVRAEQVASLKSEIAKAKARQQYVEQQLSRTDTLARTDNASQQSLDQAQNGAPTSPKPQPITTPRSPDRPKKSAPSPTRRSRPRRRRSTCCSDGSIRPYCGRPPMASSAWSSPRSARISIPASRSS
jgi:multidrug resistance efflux pump